MSPTKSNPANPRTQRKENNYVRFSMHASKQSREMDYRGISVRPFHTSSKQLCRAKQYRLTNARASSLLLANGTSPRFSGKRLMLTL